MKSRNVNVLFVLVLGGLMALAPMAQGKDDWVKEFSVDPGQTIELEMDPGGSLEVEGWDRDVVRITCTAERYDIEDWQIEVDETRDGLKLNTELKERQDNYTNLVVELMVPRKFNIKTNSGGGHICITDVEGEFQGRTSGGAIKLKNVSGEARLRTGGGYIKIVDSDLDGRISSGGGGGLVENVTGNVKATSGGGVVSYKNVRDSHGDMRGPGRLSAKGITKGTVMHSTTGGDINIKEAPEGVLVETGGGNIDIRDANRFVEAQTGGGEIEIEIVDGRVKARTGGGDIEVTVLEGLGDNRDGIDLGSDWGEVTLILPENASIELDLDLAYTRNSNRDYEIDSDFDLDIEKTRKWESDHGSPRKHIYGTATINGGSHRVIIHTVNGDIRIKKR